MQADAQQVGVMLRLAVEGDGVQLTLEGGSELVPRVLAQALARLCAAPQEAWPESGAGTAAQMPLRQLLGRLPELFAESRPAPQPPSPARVPEIYRQARLEGLGMGFAARERQALERQFAGTRVLPPAAPLAPPEPGRYWRDAAIAGEESALLLFCPQPAADAATEAAWRLLAQLYQGPFFRRLRGELQLGYALFCGFRQVQRRRGILFAVQSPQASAPELIGHIEAFLAAQGERLALLAEPELRAACGEAARQLGEQAASVSGMPSSAGSSTWPACRWPMARPCSGCWAASSGPRCCTLMTPCARRGAAGACWPAARQANRAARRRPEQPRRLGAVKPRHPPA
ncbi:hypothetical protein I0E98_03800 [Pseudomonas lalucatii]|nr:hypothetical protein [Pseudomonas lalucatii]